MNSTIRKNSSRYAGVVILGFVLFLLANSASAQPVDIPATWGGSLSDRPRLTGSWFGLRDEMGKKGVVLDIDLTQVVQGVTSGGRDDNTLYYGLAEYTLNLDSQKMGLWPGGFLNVQGMTNYGQNVDFASGAFIPPNFTSLFPMPGQSTSGLMSLTLMQFLSTKFGLFAGKLSGLGADANAFAHDYHNQFLNAGLNLNMTLCLFPFTGYGGGMVYLPWEGASLTFSAMDPGGTATHSDPSDSFRNGVLLGIEARVVVNPFCLEGHQLLGFAWSNKERLSLKQDPSNIARLLLTETFPRLGNPGPILEKILERFFPGLIVPTQPPNKVNSTWTLYYNFDQFLWSPEGHPDRGIGVFGRFGVSDGVANPVKYAFNFGISGKGIVPVRPSDNFGIGWSRVNISANFLPFLRSKVDLGLNHENAAEMYYDASLTPWLGATADLQIIDSALKKHLDSSGRLQNMDTTVVAGLRILVPQKRNNLMKRGRRISPGKNGGLT
jgi:porin